MKLEREILATEAEIIGLYLQSKNSLPNAVAYLQIAVNRYTEAALLYRQRGAILCAAYCDRQATRCRILLGLEDYHREN